MRRPVNNKSEHAHDCAGCSIRYWRSLTAVFLTTIGLLFSDVRVTHAETLLDSILWLALGGGLLENENTHIVTTQNDSVLHSTTQVDGLRPTTTTIKRLAPCEFDVDIRGAAVDGEYHLDLSQAQFDLVRMVESRNFFDHRIRVLSIPSAKICMVSGHDYLNAGINAGNCADHYDVGPAWRPQQVEYIMAEIRNVREACSAVSFKLRPSRSPGRHELGRRRARRRSTAMSVTGRSRHSNEG